MTEKRFTEIVSIKTIRDNKTGIAYTHCLVDDDFLDLINDLAEENEQLKSKINYLERKVQRERVSAMKQHEKWEKEVKKKTEKERNCGYCKYLQIDGMFGMWCDKDRDWGNTDAKHCPDYER